MVLEADEWVTKNSPIEPAKLHAMGVIHYRWNTVELLMVLLIAAVAHMPFSAAWQKTRNKRASQIYDLLRSKYHLYSRCPQVIDCVEYVIEIHQIDLRNRSQLAHFLPEGGGTERLHNSRGADYLAIFDQPPVRTELEDLRRCAEDLALLSRYITGIVNAVGDRLLPIIGGQVGDMPVKPPMPIAIWPTDKKL